MMKVGKRGEWGGGYQSGSPVSPFATKQANNYRTDLLIVVGVVFDQRRARSQVVAQLGFTVLRLEQLLTTKLKEKEEEEEEDEEEEQQGEQENEQA